MASLITRLAKIEQKRKARTNLQPIAIVIGDDAQPLEDLQRQWLSDNNLQTAPSDIDWIHIVTIGVDNS